MSRWSSAFTGESKRTGGKEEKRTIATRSRKEGAEILPGQRYSALCGVCGDGGAGTQPAFSRNPALPKPPPRKRRVVRLRLADPFPGGSGDGRPRPRLPPPRTVYAYRKPLGGPRRSPIPAGVRPGGWGHMLGAQGAPWSPAQRPRRPRPRGGPAPSGRLGGSGRRGLAWAPRRAREARAGAPPQHARRARPAARPPRPQLLAIKGRRAERSASSVRR